LFVPVHLSTSAGSPGIGSQTWRKRRILWQQAGVREFRGRGLRLRNALALEPGKNVSQALVGFGQSMAFAPHVSHERLKKTPGIIPAAGSYPWNR